MVYNPLNPNWVNRDRFILSAGHGSILVYTLMHLFGYEHSISMDDIKNFRQYGSRAAGHPENILTPGVEVTTGALGQGISNAVGMALAESHLAAVYNRPGLNVIDHYTYCIVGDGCLMEGISSEVCSLAGHWKLGKLIVLYDCNSISIEGSTDLAFTEDVCKRFEAQGWQTVQVSNGNTDVDAIHDAIVTAKRETNRPSLISISTTIGYGMPTLAGSPAIHGACLDEQEIKIAKQTVGWCAQPFEIPYQVLSHTRRKQTEGVSHEEKWQQTLSRYEEEHPYLAEQFSQLVISRQLPTALAQTFDTLHINASDISTQPTRKLSGHVLNTLSATLPNLLGGSGDLAPSTCTHLRNYPSYQRQSYHGRNIHFGVREHGMAAISNGLALHKSGLIPFCATFLVFSDYCRAAIRTAALSHAGVIFIMTHDSVLIGQDGPTHGPVEHLASLRAMPGVWTIRPGDEVETIVAYELAVESRNAPTIVVLSRQTVRCGKGSRKGALRGGYIHSDSSETPDVVLIGTGSEVGLCGEAADVMRNRGAIVRVVSMPCVELFEEQSKEYRDGVLCKEVGREKRIVVEAGTKFGWAVYADHFITIDEFGISAPLHVVREIVGLTKEAVVKKMEMVLEI